MKLNQHQKILLNKFFSNVQKQRRFQVFDEAIVDNEKWYTIGMIMNSPEEAWIRSQTKDVWYSHKSTQGVLDTFDMHEKLYAMFILRFSDAS